MEMAGLGVGVQHDIDVALKFGKGRIDRLGQGREDRKIGQRRQQASGKDDRLPADLVRQPAEQKEKRRADYQGDHHQLVGDVIIGLQRDLQEEQRIELPRIPDDALPCRRAQQRHQHIPAVRVAKEAFRDRRLRDLAGLLHVPVERRFVSRSRI